MQKNFGESTKRKNESLRIQYWANCGMLCSNSVSTNASRCIFCDLMHDFSPHEFIFRPSVLRYNPFYLNTLRVNASRVGIFSALNPLENDWNRNWYYSVRQQSYCESCGFASYFKMKNVKGIFAFGFNSSVVPTIQRESVLNGCLSSIFSTVVAIEHNFLTSLSQAFFHEHYIIRLLLYSCQQVVVYTSVTK